MQNHPQFAKVFFSYCISFNMKSISFTVYSFPYIYIVLLLNSKIEYYCSPPHTCTCCHPLSMFYPYSSASEKELDLVSLLFFVSVSPFTNYLFISRLVQSVISLYGCLSLWCRWVYTLITDRLITFCEEFVSSDLSTSLFVNFTWWKLRKFRFSLHQGKCWSIQFYDKDLFIIYLGA